MRAEKTERIANLAHIVPLRALEYLFRPVMRPGLDLFNKVARIQTTDPEVFLGECLGISSSALADLRSEFENNPVSADGRQPRFPEACKVTADEALVLYAISRVMKPERVVETGVAEGRSSRAILSALLMNSRGLLMSFDIRDDVGSLIEAKLLGRWNFQLLPQAHKRAVFSRELSRFSPIDLFFHDSMHTYEWQSREFRLAWNSLSPGGLLASDDVDSSFAFLDFCKSNAVAPDILVGERKVFGLVRKATVGSDKNQR